MSGTSGSSVSDHLSLEEAVVRLKAAPLVDGIAEFGSRATAQTGPASDYDLLILVQDIPTNVFQMITTIDGRLTDVVLVPVKTVNLLLTASETPKSGSFEALFIQKMRTAHILYDATKRLQQVQQLITSERWKVQASNNQHESNLYAAWFWQGFGLLHLERMVQSQDPIHLSAFDMMLTSCLFGTWRSYFEVRRIAWEGDKKAILYGQNMT
jgi:predicted nucleotidyltransferase